jgi:hypothetical protein
MTSRGAKPVTQIDDQSTSTTDVAKDQAAGVGQSAAGAGQHVAGVAKDEAANVAQEAARQAQDVLGQARSELTNQAAQQQERVAGGLRSLSRELGTMAERSEESGVATDLARQASAKAGEFADWLDRRDPSSLLGEVKTFARRRPGAFLAIALGAGLAAGRLTRGLKDEAAQDDTSRAAAGTPSPYAASTPAYQPPAHRPETYPETYPATYPATEDSPVSGGRFEEGEFVEIEPVPVDPYEAPLSSEEIIVSPPARSTGQEGPR